jgi:methionine-rich copper-binding protein CopC
MRVVSRRLVLVGLLAPLGASVAASSALAHALPRSSVPPAGAKLNAAPDAVIVTFSEGVELAFSTIEVRDASGARVDRNDVHIVGGDTRRLAVSLNTLAPGTYKVIWHVTSVDTHKTEGSYQFTVLP